MLILWWTKPIQAFRWPEYPGRRSAVMDGSPPNTSQEQTLFNLLHHVLKGRNPRNVPLPVVGDGIVISL